MNTQTPQQLYTYESFARLLDCSPKTLRNKVSAGLFPPPLKTAVGPRFADDHIVAAFAPDDPDDPPPPPPPKKRGRPRIALALAGKGGPK